MFAGGKFECALYGDYVGLFQDMFNNLPPNLSIVVMQFAKINIEKGLFKHLILLFNKCWCFVYLLFCNDSIFIGFTSYR